MPKIFTWDVQVRSYEIGRFGILDNAAYVNYLEELALLASADAGYGTDWFEARGSLWIIRSWILRFYNPIRYGEHLHARTWVSDFKRVQSHREYELLSGDTRVLRARANWVFVDATNLRPMRLLPEFSDAYQPSGEELEDLQVHLDNPTLIENPRQFTRQHHVQHYEMDKLRHVNNANYIRWTEEACLRALQSLGWDEKTQGFRVLSHEVDYKHSAKADDNVIITSRMTEYSAAAMKWQHEIRHQASQDLIATDTITVSLENTSIPNVLLQV